jgi:very-short-patch-repair endonuclease
LSCKLCNYKVDDVSHVNSIMNHLHDVHNITRKNGEFTKYVQRHFDNPSCACGQCGLKTSLHCRRMEFKLFADECPNQQRFKNTSCLEYYIFRGISVNNAVNHIKKRQAMIGNSANTGDHLQKLSLINSGDSNPASIVSIIKRTNENCEDVRKRLSIKSSRESNGFYGKKHSKETKEKLAIIRSKVAKQISSPELIVWGFLTALNIEFEYQVPIGPYVVDFIINGNVVEVYGDYWHGEKMRSSNKKRDEHKIEFLKRSHNVLIVWESEISKHPHEVIQKLCELNR